MIQIDSFSDLSQRARRLASRGRRILGITGPPGAGKSTLTAAIINELRGEAIDVPMDGFHLANSELVRLGRRDRKGAPDTFAAEAYVALLRRLRKQTEEVIYAPGFRREIDEPIAGAIAIPRRIPLVVTEGNYLLLDDHPWADLRSLLDEVWYLDLSDGARTERLVNRHVRYGKSLQAAQAWVRDSDESNASLVAGTRSGADVVVTGWT